MPVIYCFDIDGTICTAVPDSRYVEARPHTHVIQEINRLYDRGHVIKIMTARGSVSKKDYSDLTRQQLQEWGLKYHELIMNTKPHAHVFVDDRAIDIESWVQKLPQIRGVVAGAFDLIHPGYVRMFTEAKRMCTHLTVALHCDPSSERPEKLAPVLPVEDRILVLKAVRYVDEVITYDSESDLYNLLERGNFDLRFLGDDYRGQPITGSDLEIPIQWIDRSHNYSTTSIKRAIHDTVARKHGS